MSIENANTHPTPTIDSNPSTALGVSLDITRASVAGLAMKTYFGQSPVKQTLFTFTNVSLSVTDSNAYGSLLIGTFPHGRIHVLDCVTSLSFTTTTALASTLNSGVTCTYGVGSAAASSTTLATTMMNFMPGSGESVKTFTSSTTINVAPATVEGNLAAVSAAHLAAIRDGTGGTAVPIYLNVAAPNNAGADIDGDATLAVNGTILFTWINTGDT